MNQIIFRKGTLKWSQTIVPIEFGILNENRGAYSLEVYYEMQSSLYTFFAQKESDDFFSGFYELEGLNTENDCIIVSRLKLTNVQFDPINIAKFNCQGSVRLVKKNQVDSQIKKENQLYYIELEGMNMVFHEVTQKQVIRKGQNISKFPSADRDHNYYLLQWKNDETNKWYTLKLIFEKSEKPNTTIVKIDYITKPAFLILETEYYRIKHQLMEFLSFYNGGYVVVRKEYFGGYLLQNKLETQTTESHSFLEFEHYDLSNYLPVRDLFNGKGSGLHPYFDCFQQFLNKYELYDLGSIIQILNGVNDSGTVEQRFYTLIITLEKIAHKVHLVHESKETLIIPDSIYSEINLALVELLKNYKSSINSQGGYLELRSKLGQINKRKKGETTNKFIHLFDIAQIDLTAELQSLITEIRNSSVHQGEIGIEEERYRNYWELDKLLRDVILNLIGYKGFRRPKTW